MKTIDKAEELATTMVSLGKAVGRQTIAVITDMSQPLGRAIGNRLEVLEALDIMQGQGREDITHFICELAQLMLDLAGVTKSLEEIRSHLTGGQALTKFKEMVAAQGGDLEDLFRPSSAAYITEVYAESDGYITALPALAFGLYAMKLGAGRAVKTDTLDFETGIVFEKKVGEAVTRGDLLAKIYSNEKIDAEKLTNFQKNVTIGGEEVTPKEIIKIIR